MSRLKVRESPVIVTNHAVMRFKERWKPLDEFDWMPTNEAEWYQKVEQLFRSSSEITLGRVERIRYLINYNFEEARFFNHPGRGLQLVAVEQGTVLVIKTVINKGRNYTEKEILS